jgi:hypothetical protein
MLYTSCIKKLNTAENSNHKENKELQTAQHSKLDVQEKWILALQQ